MKILTFQYHLQNHGWARAVFSLDGVSHTLDHGYCTQPLGQIATVAVNLAKRGGLVPSAVTFDNEPGGHLASFKHRDPTEFELWSYDDLSHPETSAKQLVARGEIDSISFAISVGAALHEVYRKHGLTGFLERWDLYSFPFRQYWHLRLLLDESPLIDELNMNNPGVCRDLELQILASDPRWTTTPLTSPVRSRDLPYDIGG